MIAPAVLLLLGLLINGAVWSQIVYAQAGATTGKLRITPDAAPPLSDLDAARIEALTYRWLFHQEQVKAAKRDLDETIDAAAKRAGVTGASHRPDVGARIWRPTTGP